jgi:hypothetical protein
MDVLGFLSSAAPAALGALGAWFLVNEVDHAHQFEELSRELNKTQELLTLFQTDLREFWTRSAMVSFNCDRARAEEIASHLSDADIEKGIAGYKQFWEKQVAEGLDRWNNQTVRTQLVKRRRMLWIGFWLLMASAAVQILVAALRLSI